MSCMTVGRRQLGGQQPGLRTKHIKGTWTLLSTSGTQSGGLSMSHWGCLAYRSPHLAHWCSQHSMYLIHTPGLTLWWAGVVGRLPVCDPDSRKSELLQIANNHVQKASLNLWTWERPPLRKQNRGYDHTAWLCRI